jgi:GAF domain-containing protein
VNVVDSEKMAAVFVDLADTLVDTFDVFDLLNELIERAGEAVDAAAGGLMLAENGGELRVVAATEERVQLLELFQLQADEGPCLDCFDSGQQVEADDLERAGSRWPRFSEAAVGCGFGSVIALPLRLRMKVIGALNLFGNAGQPAVGDGPVALAQAMADVATIAVLQHRRACDRRLVAEQLQSALDSRVVIEQAKGALSARLGIAPDDAFEVLRSRARTSRRRLAEVAQEVAEGTRTTDVARHAPDAPPRASG